MAEYDPLAQPIQKAYAWIGEVQEAMGVGDRHRCYQALRASLHALRDRLNPDEAIHLGAQLPLVIRGTYYEGFTPSGKPVKQRSREEFLQAVTDEIPGMGQNEAGLAARAVFEVLERHISQGEIEDVKGVLPREVRELWPSPV